MSQYSTNHQLFKKDKSKGSFYHSHKMLINKSIVLNILICSKTPPVKGFSQGNFDILVSQAVN